MNPHASTGPLETFLLWTFLAVAGMTGLVWGSGVLAGSILGSTLPAGGDGVAAMIRTFPSVGTAWTPTIPSGLVWGGSVALAVALIPPGRAVAGLFRTTRRGAEWADTADLRQASLLVADTPIEHGRLEPEGWVDDDQDR